MVLFILCNLLVYSLFHSAGFVSHSVKYVSHTVVFIFHTVKPEKTHQNFFNSIQLFNVYIALIINLLYFYISVFFLIFIIKNR